MLLYGRDGTSAAVAVKHRYKEAVTAKNGVNFDLVVIPEELRIPFYSRDGMSAVVAAKVLSHGRV